MKFAKIFILFSFIAFQLLIGQLLFSQNPKEEQSVTRILFVLDASGSMNGVWESDFKINVAKRILGKILDSLNQYKHLEVALRVYGHQTPRNMVDCHDTKLEVGFASNNASKIKYRLRYITPKGQTPIGYSLLQSAYDFPTASSSRNIIILITDGIESCNEDPCAVSRALQKRGIFLKPFVIGLGLSTDYSEVYNCVGSYYDASSETAFESVLGVVISQAMNRTTAQVNLLDIKGSATETNVNMTFYDMSSEIVRYNYVHTINDRGEPDTIKIDPVNKYKMVVHTIPKVEKDNIELLSGKHNIIAVDAPQGQLEIKIEGKSAYKNLQIIVKMLDSSKTLHVQKINKTEKYLVGNYDLEILTLPRINLKKVKVEQSKTTTITVPRPGHISIINSIAGFGSIYRMVNQEMTWVYNLDTKLTSQTVTLQPGNYKVVFRTRKARRSIYSITKDFQIRSGAGSSVRIF